ncbi:P-loop containing nucleoside triphosphate hydrolase protein, partial [Mycena leptocephala]
FIGGNVNYIVNPPNISIAQAAQQTNNCPPPSRIFQGRQTIRDEMNQFFNQDIQKQHIYLLYGLGGAGKTQITLKFISDSSCSTDKFFLDASTKETINTGLKEIAVARNAGNSAQDALKWLVDNHEKWLLFFDNADDPSINLNTFLPRCNHGNIIITSRNPGLCVYAGSHSPVSDMEETDAVALLLKSAAQESSSANEKTGADVSQEMCYLPLAIVQAGAFISQSSALGSYLDLYVQNRAQLLNAKPTQTHDDYDWTVYTTWQMSFDKLCPPAAMLLQLCSFLHRDGISEEIFSRAATYTFPSYGPSKEELENPLQFLSQFLNPTGQWDSLCFLKVTNEIKAYSLVTFDPTRKVFSIHPLVHTWSQTTI